MQPGWDNDVSKVAGLHGREYLWPEVLMSVVSGLSLKQLWNVCWEKDCDSQQQWGVWISFQSGRNVLPQTLDCFWKSNSKSLYFLRSCMIRKGSGGPRWEQEGCWVGWSYLRWYGYSKSKTWGLSPALWSSPLKTGHQWLLGQAAQVLLWFYIADKCSPQESRRQACTVHKCQVWASNMAVFP